MFLKKKRIGSNSVVEKPENRLLRLLRLLRSDTGFQASVVSLERTGQEGVWNEDQIAIRNAMLEGEYYKAKALQAFQNNPRYY